jgi:hypothetical protein
MLFFSKLLITLLSWGWGSNCFDGGYGKFILHFGNKNEFSLKSGWWALFQPPPIWIGGGDRRRRFDKKGNKGYLFVKCLPCGIQQPGGLYWGASEELPMTGTAYF